MSEALAFDRELIGRPFQEQHPEDVFLEFEGARLSAQDVGRNKKMALHWGSVSTPRS